MTHEFARSLSAARFFRKIGLVPLPSRMDRKLPTLGKYRQFKEEQVPKVLYSEDEWKTTNLQLMTGAQTSGATKIIAIDLDGDAAVEAWKKICGAHDFRPQGIWITETGSGGKHLYFRLPHDLDSCPTRLLWGLYDPLGGSAMEGGWVKHTEVKLLGDGALIVAPPSRHVKTGREYTWIGKWSPAVFPLPAEAPRWLIESQGLAMPINPKSLSRCDGSHQPISRKRPDGKKGAGPDRAAVIEAIPPEEKIRLAVSWGLRLGVKSDSRRPWVECHAIGREDNMPSAGFDPRTGVYHDFGGACKLSFFDLAVQLGAYRTWLEALEAVGGVYRLS